MRRSRTADGVGVVFVAVALVTWWVGLPPEQVDPLFSTMNVPGLSGDAARVRQVAVQAMVVLLLTGGAAGFGAVLTDWRSRWRPVFVAPLLLVTAGLAVAQLVVSVHYQSNLFGTTNATLAGLTRASSVAAVLAASVGLALLLAGAPKRPLAVVAALLGVAAVAVVAQEALLWWHHETRHIAVPSARFILLDSLTGLLTVIGLAAFATGLRRPPGSPPREVAVGGTVLWGTVVLALELLTPTVWEQDLPFGVPRPTYDPAGPYALGVVTLLAAPAAAMLVARMRVRPGREVVTMRWRGASAALGLLLVTEVTAPLVLLLVLWPDQAQVASSLVLWLVLSGAAAVGFTLAALRRDAGPVIAVVAALLAVTSFGVAPGMYGAVTGDVRGLLPTPLVLGMLAPHVVALSVALRSLAAHRGGGEPEPAEPAEPTEPTEPTEPAQPTLPV